jgi:hypothetical protein
MMTAAFDAAGILYFQGGSVSLPVISVCSYSIGLLR